MKVFPILIAALILLSGCITSGGKKLTGIVPTDHGTYRLQSAVDREKREVAAKKKAAEEEAAAKKKAEEARQKALLESVKSPQVKLPPARSRPQPTESEQSIQPIDVPPISGVGKPIPFTPTVSEARLSPADALIQDLLNGTESKSSIVVMEEKENKDEPKVKIDWPRLIVFYLIALSFVTLVYFGWKTAKTKTKEIKPTKRSRKKVSKKQK